MVEWINKFSVPKLIHFLISLSLFIIGIVLIVIGINNMYSEEEISMIGIILLLIGFFFSVFGFAFFIQAFTYKDKYFKYDGHIVRAYVGAMNHIVYIDNKMVKRVCLMSFSSIDVINEIEGLRVVLHVNMWNGTSIFVNDKKIF